ncbi:helix-turn-helix domain-containing protein [Photobacterium satsumensis]|uniref:helix-turn-helix domain-containing protein n=1 Tax=Photobacterium satsumensis TaxID=2910239 RepID=UPI003D0E2FA2
MFHLNSEDFFSSVDANISTAIRTPQENYPEHSHDFHELVIVSKGAGQHILNDIPTNLTQNFICYVSPKDRHLYENVDGLYLSNVLFKRNKLLYSPLMKEILPKDDDNNSWYITSDSMKRVQQLVTSLDREAKLTSVEATLMKEALFQQLIVEISRGRLTTDSLNDDENMILKIIDWIQAHYDEEINITAIADQFDISSRTLSRKIKHVTNLTFNNYIHRVRINNAINLLQYSEMNITDIAFKVGYKDSNYFSTKFKRFTNRTPSEFRD